MGFLDSIFGHGESYGDLPGRANQSLDDWFNSFMEMYSPQAQRAQRERYSETEDRNIANSAAAGGRDLAGAGYRAPSGAVGNPVGASAGLPGWDNVRAQHLADFQANQEDEARKGMAGARLQKLMMLLQMKDLFHRNASGGLLGALAPIAGAYLGGGGGAALGSLFSKGGGGQPNGGPGTPGWMGNIGNGGTFPVYNPNG